MRLRRSNKEGCGARRVCAPREGSMLRSSVEAGSSRSRSCCARHRSHMRRAAPRPRSLELSRMPGRHAARRHRRSQEQPHGRHDERHHQLHRGVRRARARSGLYTITVSLTGFKTVVLTDVELLSGTPRAIKVTLEVGTLTSRSRSTAAASSSRRSRRRSPRRFASIRSRTCRSSPATR